MVIDVNVFAAELDTMVYEARRQVDAVTAMADLLQEKAAFDAHFTAGLAQLGRLGGPISGGPIHGVESVSPAQVQAPPAYAAPPAPYPPPPPAQNGWVRETLQRASEPDQSHYDEQARNSRYYFPSNPGERGTP
jgi:hypothetical protein